MNPAVKQRVDDFLVDLASAPVARHVLGVVVSGSASRGEEIWAGADLLSDIDLMVLTRRTDPRLITAIERVVGRHRHTGIDGGQVPVGPLRRYLTLAFYEARTNGVVVAGSVDLHRLIPPTRAGDLPLWEGVRVLANRLLEHVKHDAGQTTATRTVAKSYEALAEAYLVAERRYRPSYTERLAELTAGPTAAPQHVGEAMRRWLAYRVDGSPAPRAGPLDVAAARADLIGGLGHLLGRYTGVADPAELGLARLARRERHWRHRVYWALRLAARRRWADIDLRTDPVIRVWQRALAEPMSTVDQQDVLRDWRACPQVLVSR